MRRFILVAVFIALPFLPCYCFSTITLDFEDLEYQQIISGTDYQGISWEFGNAGYGEQEGCWVCSRYIYPIVPSSGTHHLTNGWGATLIGMQFSSEVNVVGAYFSRQGGSSGTTEIRVHGYWGGSEIAVTDWFDGLNSDFQWVDINLQHVDRIVIESVPMEDNAGWYGMDDFTYEIPEPASLVLFACGGLLIRKWLRC